MLGQCVCWVWYLGCVLRTGGGGVGVWVSVGTIGRCVCVLRTVCVRALCVYWGCVCDGCVCGMLGVFWRQYWVCFRGYLCVLGGGNICRGTDTPFYLTFLGGAGEG